VNSKAPKKKIIINALIITIFRYLLLSERASCDRDGHEDIVCRMVLLSSCQVQPASGLLCVLGLDANDVLGKIEREREKERERERKRKRKRQQEGKNHSLSVEVCDPHHSLRNRMSLVGREAIIGKGLLLVLGHSNTLQISLSLLSLSLSLSHMRGCVIYVCTYTHIFSLLYSHKCRSNTRSSHLIQASSELISRLQHPQIGRQVQ